MRRSLAVAVIVTGAAIVWWLLVDRPATRRIQARVEAHQQMKQTHQARSVQDPGNESTPASSGAINSTPIVTRPAQSQRQMLLSAPVPSSESGSAFPPIVLMENMRSVFRQYASRYGGNPVGTNPEITAALNGSNPQHVTFLGSEDGFRVDDQGRLLDSWGTPFFFHQISGTEMEIHSAGPDRKMWTRDDLVIK